MRILRRANATPVFVKTAQWLVCTSCGDAVRVRHPRPVKMPGHYVFNLKVLMDVFSLFDAAGTRYHALGIICSGTTFHVVAILGYASGVPKSSIIWAAFTLVWTRWAGMPNTTFVDRGKEFMGEVATQAARHGVIIDAAATEAAWQLGLIERHDGIWSEIWRRVMHADQVTGLAEVRTTSGIVTSTKNEMQRHDGFSPASWVLGSHGLRVPGSLLQDSEAQRLEVQQEADDPASEFDSSLRRREKRMAFIRIDSDCRARRAMLRRTRPQRGPFVIGSWVYCHR